MINKKLKKVQVAKKSQTELSSSSRKRALKHERQANRRHADSVKGAKEIWNQLRKKTNSLEEVKQLTEKLMGLIKGKVVEICLQHDASRVVQAAIQFGSDLDRKEIVDEICRSGNLLELCKIQYAHFVVLKMIKYCSDEKSVATISRAFKGEIAKLAVHTIGSRVVELLFSTFPKTAVSDLKQELFGPLLSLFHFENKSSSRLLRSRLEASPEKRDTTMQYITSLLNKMIEKGLLGFAFVQTLFSEFMDSASFDEKRALIPNLVDNALHLMSTKDGTSVVVACASYGTAKDRKRLMKSLKGYSKSSLLHRDAYLALLQLVNCTDDTVSIHKLLLAELLVPPEEDGDSPLLEIALNENASKLFLLILVESEGDLKKYLNESERGILCHVPTYIENGQKVPTSKKSHGTRRRELLDRTRIPLIELCQRHANDLLRSIPGSRVLKEVYKSLRPPELIESVLECIDNDEYKVAICDDPVGHLTIKHLILADEQEHGRFGILLVQKMKGKLFTMAKSNRGCFVLIALCKLKKVAPKVTSELMQHKADLRKANETPGLRSLRKELGL